MLPFAAKVIGLGQRRADAADIAQPRLAADLEAAAAPVLVREQVHQFQAHNSLDVALQLGEFYVA